MKVTIINAVCLLAIFGAVSAQRTRSRNPAAARRNAQTNLAAGAQTTRRQSRNRRPGANANANANNAANNSGAKLADATTATAKVFGIQVSNRTLANYADAEQARLDYAWLDTCAQGAAMCCFTEGSPANNTRVCGTGQRARCVGTVFADRSLEQRKQTMAAIQLKLREASFGSVAGGFPTCGCIESMPKVPRAAFYTTVGDGQQVVPCARLSGQRLGLREAYAAVHGNATALENLRPCSRNANANANANAVNANNTNVAENKLVASPSSTSSSSSVVVIAAAVATPSAAVSSSSTESVMQTTATLTVTELQKQAVQTSTSAVQTSTSAVQTSTSAVQTSTSAAQSGLFWYTSLLPAASSTSASTTRAPAAITTQTVTAPANATTTESATVTATSSSSSIETTSSESETASHTSSQTTSSASPTSTPENKENNEADADELKSEGFVPSFNGALMLVAVGLFTTIFI